MAYIHAIVAGNSELVLYALSLFVGALPKGFLLLQRRGFGRRGFGRRRRSRGIFGALGALIVLFVIGPIVVLALIAYVAYRLLTGRRER